MASFNKWSPNTRRPVIRTVICSMGRLNQIEIRESELTYSSRRDWFFHPTGHHVRELLLHFIGSDYVLDGSSKFSAIFGPRPDYDDPIKIVLGVTAYYIEDFDIEGYMKLPVEEQQEMILTELTDNMVHAADAAGSDTNVILNAASKVRQNGFVAEVPIGKLSRSTKDRKLRVHVFRCLGPRIGEVWETRICRRDGSVIGVKLITDCPDHLDRTDQYSKSTMSGAVYQIISSRFKKIEYSLDLSPYIEKGR